MSHLISMKPENGTWVLNRTGAIGCTSDLSRKYQSAEPFPHIVIDDFVEPKALEAVLDAFPKSRDGTAEFRNPQESLKTQFHPRFADSLSAQHFVNEFNTDVFIDFLSELTGIKGLVPDPHFIGGGFHETRTGGKLNIHADFSHHLSTNLERRINLILFLNQDWKEEYGGNLELWDRTMRECVVDVSPAFNRAVIFNTDTTSYHGHPDPLNTPSSVTRRSIALYYYSLPRNLENFIQRSSTDFKARPGSKDVASSGYGYRSILRDLTPPIVWRALQGSRRT